jgi:uncharacterized membrane protein YgcG
VALWNWVGVREAMRTLAPPARTPPSPVSCVAWSASSHWVAAGYAGDGGAVNVWRADTGAVLATLHLGGGVRRVQFHPLLSALVIVVPDSGPLAVVCLADGRMLRLPRAALCDRDGAGAGDGAPAHAAAQGGEGCSPAAKRGRWDGGSHAWSASGAGRDVAHAQLDAVWDVRPGHADRLVVVDAAGACWSVRLNLVTRALQTAADTSGTLTDRLRRVAHPWHGLAEADCTATSSFWLQAPAADALPCLLAWSGGMAMAAAGSVLPLWQAGGGLGEPVSVATSSRATMPGAAGISIGCGGRLLAAVSRDPTARGSSLLEGVASAAPAVAPHDLSLTIAPHSLWDVDAAACSTLTKTGPSVGSATTAAVSVHPTLPCLLAVTSEGGLACCDAPVAARDELSGGSFGPMFPAGWRMVLRNREVQEAEDELDRECTVEGYVRGGGRGKQVAHGCVPCVRNTGDAARDTPPPASAVMDEDGRYTKARDWRGVRHWERGVKGSSLDLCGSSESRREGRSQCHALLAAAQAWVPPQSRSLDTAPAQEGRGMHMAALWCGREARLDDLAAAAAALGGLSGVTASDLQPDMPSSPSRVGAKRVRPAVSAVDECLPFERVGGGPGEPLAGSVAQWLVLDASGGRAAVWVELPAGGALWQARHRLAGPAVAGAGGMGDPHHPARLNGVAVLVGGECPTAAPAATDSLPPVDVGRFTILTRLVELATERGPLPPDLAALTPATPLHASPPHGEAPAPAPGWMLPAPAHHFSGSARPLPSLCTDVPDMPDASPATAAVAAAAREYGHELLQWCQHAEARASNTVSGSPGRGGGEAGGGGSEGGGVGNVRWARLLVESSVSSPHSCAPGAVGRLAATGTHVGGSGHPAEDAPRPDHARSSGVGRTSGPA